MFSKFPAIYLILSIMAYFSLWLFTPHATFLVDLVNDLGIAYVLIGGPLGVFSLIVGSVIISIPTVAFMAVQIAILYHFARLRMNIWQSLIAFFGSIAAIFLLIGIIALRTGITSKLNHYPTLREQLFILGNYYGPEKLFSSLLIIFASASLGYMVSLKIRDKNLLLPVVLFAAFIDFWTVTQGPVSQIIQKRPEIVPAVSVPIPQVGAGAFVPDSMIGPGDFIFMTLVFAVIHKLNMRPRRNYWFIFGAMTIGMLLVTSGLLHSLPALIVLAIGVVAANFKQFKLSRQEAISIAIVAILLAASLPLVWSLIRNRAVQDNKQNNIKQKATLELKNNFSQKASGK